MKYVRERNSINGKGVNQLWFLLGKQEVEILKALVEKALRYMPTTFETSTALQRLRNIRNSMEKAASDIKNYEG